METVTWISPQGQSLLLDADNFFIMQGLDGRGLPPVDNVVDVVPAIEGARLRQVNIKTRDIMIPLNFTSVEGKKEDMRAFMRSIMTLFNTKDADGTLVVQYSDGTTRRINCRYSNGLHVEESGSYAAVGFQQVQLVITAIDPYWYGDTVVRSWQLGAGTSFFGNPFFPLRLSPSSVFGSGVATNPGDADAYPVWTVTGPGSALSIQNLTTGDHITLSNAIAAGEVITIDTRAGQKTIVSSVHGNIYGTMSIDSRLWALPPGDSSLNFGMTDATSAASISMLFNPRYLSA